MSSQQAIDEAEVVREIRALRDSSGHGEIVIKLRDGVVQVIETTQRRKPRKG